MAREPHPLVAELKSVREGAGLSVWEAARRAGLATAVVRDWESGRSEPTVVALEKYLAVFGRRLWSAGAEAEVLHAEAVRRLELETLPDRPTQPELPPVTPDQAAENRRVLAAALGITDDLPLSPAAIVEEFNRRAAA
ncbi:helix-turn-helix domain-containing protein [Actinomadura rubrisoli]|nr:helix-turn-helix transcriptional regulator [Actinomadura rubrisoli]